MMASNTHDTNHDQPTLHHQYDVPTFAVRTTSSPPVLPTMVALVSPNISSVSWSRRNDVQRNGDTQHPPSRHVSMAVHYLPDPYHQNSTNQNSSSSNNSSNSSSTTNTNSNRMNTNSHSSSSQLRPYFLLRRERPLFPHNNYDPTHPSEMGNPTTTTDATIIPSNHSSSSSSIQYEEYYQLCEMTMIDDDDAMNSSNTMNEDKQNYHSFLISNRNHNDTNTLSSYVVQNGSLYVMTPIDSLFWLLRDTYLPSTTTTSNTTSSTIILDTEPPKKQQWQPLLQFLQEYDPVIQKCVYGPNKTQQQQQYKHLLNEMSLGNHTDDDDNNDVDDSMTLVQFSIEKALLWLHQKQQTMERYLLRVVSSSSSQQQQHHHHNNNSNRNSNTSGNNNNNNKGAFTSGFTVAKENKITACNMTINVENEEKQEQERKEQQQQQYRIMVKEESMQLVCNYLTPAWQDHFLQYMRDHDPDYALVQWKNEPPENLLEPNKDRNKRSKSEVDTNKTTTIQASITDVTTMTPTVDWNMSLTTSCCTNDTSTTTTTSSKSKKLLLVQPITAGAKRLLKVNQRGIQSVSSFFGVGSTKNKAKK